MITERKLSKEEQAELQDARESFVLEREGLPELLTSLRMGPDDDVVFHLGVWLGDRVAELTGWVWVHVALGPGLEAPALVSADRGLCFLPLQAVVHAVERAPDPWNPGPEPLVHMLERLEGGGRPQGAEGSYALVTP